MAQRSLPLVALVAICCFSAATATGRHLMQSGGVSECYVSIAEKSTGAKDCIWVVSGVSSSQCSARSSNQPDEATLFGTNSQLCTLPMPYACSSLAVSAKSPAACSDSMADAVVAILQKASETGLDDKALNTNGAILSKGGRLVSAAGTTLAKGS